MIKPEKVIFKGKARTVYLHPQHRHRVIKIENRLKVGTGKIGYAIIQTLHDWIPLLSENRRELLIYTKLEKQLGAFLPMYEKKLVHTEKGVGLVCELLADENLNRLPTLLEAVQSDPGSVDGLRSELEKFFALLFESKLYFYDFNPNNFLVGRNEDGFRLWFVDLKGYRKDRTILPVTYLSRNLAERKMRRRMNRLFNLLDTIAGKHPEK